MVLCVSRPPFTLGTESGTNFGHIQVRILIASSEATCMEGMEWGRVNLTLTP